MPVTARSKAWVYGRSLAGTAGSNPARRDEYLSVVTCVLSGRGLCDGPISHAGQSYRVWCV